jgi:precorrin-8X/cobalt-precorrin-8 methylmutase
VSHLFDAYIAIDWSASSSPKTGKDSIWLCVHGVAPENPATRDEATTQVRETLLRLVADGRRVLIGFDFPYGYPAGFADVVAPGPARPWRRTWDVLTRVISDDERNVNNRFEVAAELNVDGGPFWGCPASQASERLTLKRGISFPHHGVQEFRAVDRAAPGVQSPWKLYGAGSVGSQALVGIPRAASLRDDPALSSVSAVWPFEEFATAQIVHVEIWPRLVESVPHEIRDAGQVEAVVREWALLDSAGALAPLFDVPHLCRTEEGWIFGVSPR